MKRTALSQCASLAAVVLLTGTLITHATQIFAAEAGGGFFGAWKETGGNYAPKGTQIRIQMDGDAATGGYDLNGGQLKGRLNNDKIEGYWTQSSANRICDESRDGTRYWGRFTFVLSSNGKKLHGLWSYCNDPAGAGGDLEARRIW